MILGVTMNKQVMSTNRNIFNTVYTLYNLLRCPALLLDQPNWFLPKVQKSEHSCLPKTQLRTESYFCFSSSLQQNSHKFKT